MITVLCGSLVVALAAP
nr:MULTISPECIES: hypothetical protein [Vibrio]